MSKAPMTTEKNEGQMSGATADKVATPPAPKMNKGVASSFAKLAKAYLAQATAAIGKGDEASALTALDKCNEYVGKALAECRPA